MKQNKTHIEPRFLLNQCDTRWVIKISIRRGTYISYHQFFK